MSCDHINIGKRISMYKELSYLGGMIEEELAKELKKVMPAGFQIADLNNISGPEMYDSIDYVQTEIEKAGLYLNRYSCRYGNAEDMNEWFTGEALRLRGDTEIEKLVSRLDENCIQVSIVEAEIIYYIFGMDGKGKRGVKEISQVEGLKPGLKYACFLAECIIGDNGLYGQLKDCLDNKNTGKSKNSRRI